MDRPTVLVVDDDQSLLDLLEVVLGHDFDLLTAADGQQALDVLATGEIDAVVLDIMMPEVDGFEVLREVRARTLTKDVVVVMLTARVGADWRAASDRLGADGYLAKPYDPDVLVGTVHRLLARTPDQRWAARSATEAALTR